MPVTPIMRVKFGSHLYGTSTPSSDTDYKGVHVPSAEALVLCKPENHVDFDSKKDSSRKNTAEDVDDESFSIQKFFTMIEKGDTVAIEMLYAPNHMLELTSPAWGLVQSQRHLLVNRQCKGFVGYCQRQAAKYGIRGSRIAAVRLMVQTLDSIIERNGSNMRMGEFEDAWKHLITLVEHASIINIPNPDGSEHLHIDVCDRKMGWQTSVKFARDVYAKVLENYGHRALAAEQNKGIDWKAVSHAVRVGRQAIELLSTGNLIFPRPDAANLLDIKLGRIPYDTVSKELEATMQEVEAVSLTSNLPERSDRVRMDAIIEGFHLSVIGQTFFKGAVPQ